MTPLKQFEPYRAKMKKIMFLGKIRLTLFLTWYFWSKRWNVYFIWQYDRL